MEFGNGRYTYELVDGWAKLPPGQSFLDVGGLAIDSEDRVYIFNRSAQPVTVFAPDGKLLTSWGEGVFKRAHGCCIGVDGSVYCTDDGHHTVSKFAPDGKLLMQIGNTDQPSDTGFVHTPGLTMTACYYTVKRGGPPFNCPTGVALSLSGEIYVSDGYGNARVHKFSPDGTLLLSWGEPGIATGQFRLPHSVWVDKKERVWVADRENNRIQIFDSQGKFLDQWTNVSRPTDIFIDDAENVYISELNQRVSIFTITGELLTRWGSVGPYDGPPLFIAPHAVAVDSQGDIYVGEVSFAVTKVDRGARTVQKFAKKTRT